MFELSKLGVCSLVIRRKPRQIAMKNSAASDYFIPDRKVKATITKKN